MGRGMDGDEYDDYLVDKAKEILDQEMETDAEEEGVDRPEMKQKRRELDEKAERDSTGKIPFSWDPREVKHLTRNRHRMTNEEMRKFLEKRGKLQEKLAEVDEWKGFSRWEERFMVQQMNTEPEEIAEELGRDREKVEIKMHIMGLRSIRDEQE